MISVGTLGSRMVETRNVAQGEIAARVIGTAGRRRLRRIFTGFGLSNSTPVFRAKEGLGDSCLHGEIASVHGHLFSRFVGEKSENSGCEYIRLLFAYTILVFNLPDARICDFTVRCKGCGENIPAPVQTMPDTWIAAVCPICGERRYYLPMDIFRGRLSFLLTRKPVQSERRTF